MDDDGSKSLDYEEFKKGLHDYGVVLDETVIFYVLKFMRNSELHSCTCRSILYCTTCTWEYYTVLHVHVGLYAVLHVHVGYMYYCTVLHVHMATILYYMYM